MAESQKVITVFMEWLRSNRDIFLPEAWKNLPELKKDLEELAEPQLFDIADKIDDWCESNGLGDQLREAAPSGRKRKDIDDPPEFDTSDPGVIDNMVQALRPSIQEAYEALQKEAEQQQPGSQDD